MATSTGPDLFAPDFKANPYPVYEQLRRHSPVRPVDVPTGRLWLVTRYADARQALTDPRLVKDPAAAGLAGAFQAREESLLSNHMLSADPPVHTRLRRLVNKVFTAGRIEALRPRVRDIAESLVEDMAARGGADLIAEF